MSESKVPEIALAISGTFYANRYKNGFNIEFMWYNKRAKRYYYTLWICLLSNIRYHNFYLLVNLNINDKNRNHENK